MSTMSLKNCDQVSIVRVNSFSFFVDIFFIFLTKKIYYDKEKCFYHRSDCPYLNLMVLCEL